MLSLFTDTRGNVAVIFGLAILPLLAAVGIAVEYSRANSARTAMQAALDSAALMLSKDAPNLSATEVTQKGQAYFLALINRPELKNIGVTATYTSGTSQGSTVVMSATSTITTDLLRVIGYPSLDLKVGSTAAWSNTRLRVALALDSTGSMGSKGKMPAMQEAAKRLIDQLSKNVKTTGDLYMSVIPFSTHVNVGPTNYQQPWLDWQYWEEDNGNCDKGGGPRTKCVSKGNAWTPDNHITWNGCVPDRDEDYDVKKTPPSVANVSTLFQPAQFNQCPAQLVPLTYDWLRLKAAIDLMKPGGPTNQPVGMAWAWLSLMPTLPLNAPAEDAGYNYKKIIIILSDGLNTKGKKTGNGSDHDTHVDARQKLLCDNIKADGVITYAIQVNTDKDPESTILRYCATKDENFFMLTSPTQIMAAFDTIGASLSKLRIAK